MKFRNILSIILCIVLICSLLPNISLAQTVDEGVITLTPSDATLDLSVDTESKITIDDGLSVSYDSALNMRLTVGVSGSGNVLDYDIDKLPANMDVTFEYSPDSVTFEGTADPTVWQDFLRSVTLSIHPVCLCQRRTSKSGYILSRRNEYRFKIWCYCRANQILRDPRHDESGWSIKAIVREQGRG